MEAIPRCASIFVGAKEPGYKNELGTKARFGQLGGIAVDSDGIIYVSDIDNQCIRRIQHGDVTTLLSDKVGRGLAVDPDGTLYYTVHPGVTELDGQFLKQRTKDGRVRTLAGTHAESDETDYVPMINGDIDDIYIHENGNIYFWDPDVIRTIDRTGNVQTIGDVGTPEVEGLVHPPGAATDAEGNLYYSNHWNSVFDITNIEENCILKIDASRNIEARYPVNIPAEEIVRDTYFAFDKKRNLLFCATGHCVYVVFPDLDSIEGEGLMTRLPQALAIQKKLNDLDAVNATSNFITEDVATTYLMPFVLGGKPEAIGQLRKKLLAMLRAKTEGTQLARLFIKKQQTGAGRKTRKTRKAKKAKKTGKIHTRKH